MGIRPVTVLLLVLLAAAGHDARADSRREALEAKFAARRRTLLVETSQEHLRIGVWCRDAGLVPQATAEFLRAVDVADGQHPGAERVLALMRRLDDRFWRTVRRNPSRGLLAKYDRKARRAAGDLEKRRLKLAAWALRHDELEERAYDEFRAVVADSGRPLEVDGSGRIVLDAGRLPEEVSRRLVDEAVTINDTLYLRDSFLALVPSLASLSEAANDELRVRTPLGEDHARTLLAVGTALLPELEEELGGRPTRRIDLFVFATRAGYEAYLEAAGLSRFRVATGFADGGRHVATVCGEGLDADTLVGVALHELAHLVHHEVTPVVMPSWYAEGFAETWGGEGTYRRAEDGTLELGGPLAERRLAPLRAGDGWIPLAELVGADALQLLSSDRERGHRFYAQSWALFTYLRAHAREEWRERFAHWETVCRGAALGAEAGDAYGGDTQPAARLFTRLFGDDLPDLEPALRAWLAAED